MVFMKDFLESYNASLITVLLIQGTVITDDNILKIVSD